MFEALNEYIDTIPFTGIPSVDVTVGLGNKRLYRHTAGFTDIDKTRIPDDDTVYQLFSATKPITCTAGVQLLCRGKMSLDDPVSKYLPEFANVTLLKNNIAEPAQNKMLIRHLFTMTAGLGYDTKAPALVKAKLDNPDAGTREILRALATIPLYSEPGTHFRYSFCHDVLAGVIEQVAGMRFGEYLKKEIFDPLEMEGFGFTMPAGDRWYLPPQYSYNSKLNVSTLKGNDNSYMLSNNYESGGAGLFGTTDGYARFCEALASGGKGRSGAVILPPEGVAMMTENLLDNTCLEDFRSEPRKWGYGWGLCGRVHMNPIVSLSQSPVGEFGWDSATGCYAHMDTTYGVSIFLAAHVRGAGYIYDHVHAHLRNLVYSELRKEKLI